jgi:predicted DNA-binding protein (MmcQ/YjbR family)
VSVPGGVCRRRPPYVPAITPGYHLNKRHWNTVAVDGSLPERMLRDMVEDSYDLVVSAFPKHMRDDLGWP